MVQQEKELVPCLESLSKEAKMTVGWRSCPVLTVEINRANIRVHWLRTAVWLTQEWPYCRNQEASGYRLCTTLPHSSLLLTPHYSFLLTPHSSSILITPHSLLILALLNPPFSSFTCVVIPPHSFSLFLIPLSPSFALTFSPYYFLSRPVFG